MSETNNQVTSNNTAPKRNLLSNFFEWTSALIVVLTIIGFIFLISTKSCNQIKNKNVYVDTFYLTKIDYCQVQNQLADSSYVKINRELFTNLNRVTDSINQRINEINQLSESFKLEQQENNESFRFYLTIISFIFVLIGFFSFKSIHDSRENAIKNATEEAKRIAERETKTYAEKEARAIASTTAKEAVKSETQEYLDQNLEKHLNKIEKIVVKEYENRIKRIEDDIDILKNPLKFGLNEVPQVYKLINEKIETLNISILELKKELESYKNNELKKSIILELSNKSSKQDD